MEKIIKIATLNKDGLQTRVALNERTVEDYVEAMREGEVFPAVQVYKDGSTYYLADGFHRVEAALRAGKRDIKANVINGDYTDALRYALGCNARHGLRRSNEDKRRALEIAWAHRKELWECDPSAALLAAVCGVHRNTAQAFIAECAEVKPTLPKRKGQVAQIVQPQMPKRVMGQDGKTYPKRPLPPLTPPKHIVPVDRYGVEIPLNIQGAFGEDSLADILSSISAARSRLRKGIEDKDPQYAAVRQDALVNLDNAYNFVAAASPHCVCRMCQGQGCKACHKRGWQTKEEYERNPREFKAK